jgi:Zn-dependent protease with chaperone function
MGVRSPLRPAFDDLGAGQAELIVNPEPDQDLPGGLLRLGGDDSSGPMGVLLNHATAAMCIDDPLQHHEGRIHRLFDTHPPIAYRIAALERTAQGLSV